MEGTLAFGEGFVMERVLSGQEGGFDNNTLQMCKNMI